jgi:hypothetical protein
VQDPDDHYGMLMHPVDDDERQWRQRQFASVFETSDSPDARKTRQNRNPFLYLIGDPLRRVRPIAFDVTHNQREVLSRFGRPADLH